MISVGILADQIYASVWIWLSKQSFERVMT